MCSGPHPLCTPRCPLCPLLCTQTFPFPSSDIDLYANSDHNPSPAADGLFSPLLCSPSCPFSSTHFPPSPYILLLGPLGLPFAVFSALLDPPPSPTRGSQGPCSSDASIRAWGLRYSSGCPQALVNHLFILFQVLYRNSPTTVLSVPLCRPASAPTTGCCGARGQNKLPAFPSSAPWLTQSAPHPSCGCFKTQSPFIRPSPTLRA